MKRLKFPARIDFEERNAEMGFDFSEIDGQEYWAETIGYVLNSKEVDALETATNELYRMSLDAVEAIVNDDRLLDLYGYDDETKALIKTSWEEDEFTCYGRFDLSFNGLNEIKLLEYNADTPTTLLESAVIQYQWKEQREDLKSFDQFNSIHERLIEFWGRYKQSMKLGDKVHFAFARDALEDFRTCEYLADTAHQAGISIKILPIDTIGSDGETFIDQEDERIEHLFKLYPYEWLLDEEFGHVIFKRKVRLLEAPWKMLLSNKTILAILWKLNEGHPLLLPSFLEEPSEGNFVKKPLLGREGMNVTLDGKLYNEGDYTGPSIYQKKVELPKQEGVYTVIGSWVIDGEAAGVCIREDSSPVMSNRSLFVPHYFILE